MKNRARKTLLYQCLKWYIGEYKLDEIIDLMNTDNIDDYDIEKCDSDYWENYITYYDSDYPEEFKNQAKMGQEIPLVYFPKRVETLQRLFELKNDCLHYSLKAGVKDDRIWGFLRLMNGYDLVAYFYFDSSLTNDRDDFIEVKEAIKLVDDCIVRKLCGFFVSTYVDDEALELVNDKLDYWIDFY